MSEIAKIVKSIIELIPQNADPKTILLIVIIILLIYGLHKANVIYDFWERLNERDITRLKKMLTDEYVPEEIKENIRRKIRFIWCKQIDQTITRITRNIYLQDEIITYYLLSKGRLRYPDFRKILGFLKIDQNEILIIRKANKCDRTKQVLSLLICAYFLCGFLIILFGIGLVLTEESIGQAQANSVLIFLILMIVPFLITFLKFLAPVLSTYAADKIRNEVEMNELISQYKKKKLEARVPAEKIKKDNSFTVLDKIFKRSKIKKRARR